MRKLGTVVVVAVVGATMALSVGVAHATVRAVSFSAPTLHATGDNPYGLAVGDLNGDSFPDLVATHQPSGISVLLGNGTGGFGAHADFATGNDPQSVALGDLNGDQLLDAVVANVTSNNVSVLLGDGTGSFAAKTDYATGSQPTAVALSDLNGDGHLDVVTANDVSNSMSVLLGDGTGGFLAHADFAVGGNPSSVALGDLNGDHFPDAVVANVTSNSVSVLLGDGAGNFGAHVDFATPTAPFSVTIGDLNRDNIPDLATANQTANDVSVLLGDGTGKFGAHADFATGENPDSVAVGDLNADTFPDLVVANISSNSVSVLLGDGSGSFATHVDFSVGANPAAPRIVTVADLNGDSRLDVAVPIGLADSVSVRLNTTPPPTAPDAPTIGTAVAGNASATMSWTAGSDGGSPITGYVVTPYIDNAAQSPSTFTSPATTETITGLTNGTTYTFTVAAINAIGTGPESTSSNPVTPAPTSPDAPTIQRNATAGNQSATISWLAPVSDGGSPIVGYVVVGYVGFAQAKVRIFNSPLTTQTITGLTNGTTYRFRVLAYNSVGVSEYSKVSNPVTPSA